MKKVFLSALFTTNLILSTASFGGGVDRASLEADVRTTVHLICEVSGVSQHEDELYVTVINCDGMKQLGLHIDIKNPMINSISTMAQNALISKKKIQFSAKNYDFESVTPDRTAEVLKIKSFTLLSE